MSVGRLVVWSVCNAFVRRSTRRTFLAYLALFHSIHIFIFPLLSFSISCFLSSLPYVFPYAPLSFPSPFSFLSLTGATSFISLYDLVSALPPARKSRWSRLWMISDSRSDIIHPLIYNHPVTNRETLCFHGGMTEAFAVDYDVNTTTAAQVLGHSDSNAILREIHDEITQEQKDKIYHHHWQVGDFIISDNLAVGHEATPETQLPVKEIGLRVLHRTTIKGTVPPAKN